MWQDPMWWSSADGGEFATYSALGELLLLSGNEASEDNGGENGQLHVDYLVENGLMVRKTKDGRRLKESYNVNDSERASGV